MKSKRDCSFLPFRFDIKGILLYNIMKCNLEEYAMNAIGEIGNFIMTYQEPLQVAATAALVVGGVICIGKVIVRSHKKQKMLEEISQTVTEINTNVKHLNDRKTEVIYIDGRMAPQAATPPRPVEVKKTTIVAETPETKECEVRKMPETEEVPAVKYFSRDCAVAKDGRRYTFEELDAQIRD